jgi:membrane fusion protein, heavy metal efflux system
MKSLFQKNILLIALTLILAACGGEKTSESAENDSKPVTNDTLSDASKSIRFSNDQYRLSEIKSGSIESRNLSNIVRLTGVFDVEPASVATVSAPLGGYVKTPGLIPGQGIKKGQILATIENAEFITLQQDFLESLGRFQYLEQEYNRQQKLRAEDINAAKTLEQVASDYKILQARISGIEQKLELVGINVSTLKQNGKIVRTSHIYSPISGNIKASNVNIGKYVNPSDVLFEIVNKKELHLALNALERDASKIKVGQVVKFSLANEDTYNRTAKVFLVGQAAENDRSVSIHCHLLPQDNSQLLPGMYVKASVALGMSLQLAVPTEAIVQLEGKDYIISQTNSKENSYSFGLIQVIKGIEQDAYTAISLPEGIRSENLTIVLKNAYTILSAIKNSEEE